MSLTWHRDHKNIVDLTALTSPENELERLAGLGLERDVKVLFMKRVAVECWMNPGTGARGPDEDPFRKLYRAPRF